jgi:glycosyltransferase involved in cell wall biosynthesis
MRLIFVNRFYWPETPATGQLLTDLAEFMAEKGYPVEVICSHPGTAGLPATELHHGVLIHRLHASRSGNSSLRHKAVDFATFYLQALWRLFALANRNSMIISLTDPPLLGIGARLVACLRHARLVHWVQDVYPELAIELAGQHWLRLIQPLRDLAWRSADSCVTLGVEMNARLEAAGVPSARRTVIENWAPAGLRLMARVDESPARTALGLKGKFVVGYSGNLGRVHDLEPVLDIAAALREHDDIVFVLIGGGPQREALQTAAQRRQLSNVAFHSARSREDLAHSLAIADVHLVTLRAGCEHLVFPSKLYGSAALGRPILFVGPPGCEIAQVVRQHGMGFVGSRDDIAGLVAAIRRLRDNNPVWQACAEAAARFAGTRTLATAGARWRTVIDAIAGVDSLSRPAPR